jgi:hypothetical protein
MAEEPKKDIICKEAMEHIRQCPKCWKALVKEVKRMLKAEKDE